MLRRIVGLEFYGSIEFGFSTHPIAFVIKSYVGQRTMRFGIAIQVCRPYEWRDRCFSPRTAARWKEIFQAAEKAGGSQYYLGEKEGSAYPAL